VLRIDRVTFGDLRRFIDNRVFGLYLKADTFDLCVKIHGYHLQKEIYLHT